VSDAGVASLVGGAQGTSYELQHVRSHAAEVTVNSQGQRVTTNNPVRLAPQDEVLERLAKTL
jgi:hypothetical protein